MSDFTDPEFIASAHAWGDAATRSLGSSVVAPIEQVHVRPWSTVFRIPTASGALYLKCCGPTQRHEPALSALLHRSAPGFVPDVLAVHERQPWMLVADGGAQLRDTYEGDALLAAWREILPRCAVVQRAFAARVGEVLATATPDHRAGELVTGLERAIADERALYAGRDDALTPAEQAALSSVARTLERHLRDLASFGIDATVQHDDLHDGNVLVRDGRALIFDWGDACVSHPFMTLTVTLRVIAWRAGIDENDAAVDALRDAYLEPWADLGSRADLRRAAELARRLGQVSRALCWDRVSTAYPRVIETHPGFSDTLRLVTELVGALDEVDRR